MLKGLQVVVDAMLDLLSARVCNLLKHSLSNETKEMISFDAMLPVVSATPSDILPCVQRALAEIPKKKPIRISVYMAKQSLVSIPILGIKSFSIKSFSQHWELCIVLGKQCLRFSSQGITCTFKGMKGAILNGAMHKTPGKHVIDVTSELVNSMDFEYLEFIGSSDTSIKRLIAQLILVVNGSEYNLVKNNCQDIARNFAGSILPTSELQTTQIERFRDNTMSIMNTTRRVVTPSDDTAEQKNTKRRVDTPSDDTGNEKEKAKRPKYGTVLRNATIVCPI